MIFPGMEKIYSSKASCHSSGEICSHEGETHPQQQARGRNPDQDPVQLFLHCPVP